MNLESETLSYSFQWQPPEYHQKGIFKNFVKFTGKQLCQKLSFNKVAGLSFSEYLI